MGSDHHWSARRSFDTLTSSPPPPPAIHPRFPPPPPTAIHPRGLRNGGHTVPHLPSAIPPVEHCMCPGSVTRIPRGTEGHLVRLRDAGCSPMSPDRHQTPVVSRGHGQTVLFGGRQRRPAMQRARGTARHPIATATPNAAPGGA